MKSTTLRRLLRPVPAGLLIAAALATSPSASAQSVVLDQFDGIRGHVGFYVNAANTSGAASPGGLLQVSESSVVYRPWAPSSESWELPLSQQSEKNRFFAEGYRGVTSLTSGVRNPRACQDPESGRFLVTGTEIRSHQITGQTRWTHSSLLHLAVSTNATPGKKDWFFRTIPVRLTDGEFDILEEAGGFSNPVPGVDGQHFYVTGTLRRMEGPGAGVFTDARELAIYAFPKAALLANAPEDPKIFRSPVVPAAEPAMPAVATPHPVDAWFASLTGNPFSPTLRLHYFDELATGFRYDYDETDADGSSVSDNAEQPQTPLPAGGWAAGDAAPDLQADNGLLASAVRVGNFFWVVWTGHEGGRSVIHWAKLHPGPPGSGETILDEEGYLDAGGDRENLRPAIGANPHGDLCLVWTTSSLTTAPAIWYSVRLLHGAWEAPHLLKQSAQPANLSLLDEDAAHWGKGTVTTDPRDNNFLVGHEYSASPSADARGFWWARISPCPLPVITATGPASPAVALKGGTLALTASVSGQWSASRWEHDPGLNPEWNGGTTVPGSVNALNTHRSGLLLEHRGKYRLTVTTACGTLLTGPIVRVEVIGPPVALSRPGWEFSCPGDSTWFRVAVEAERLDLHYLEEFPAPATVEWYRLGDPAPYPGVVIQPGSTLDTLSGDEERLLQNFALIFPLVTRELAGVWKVRMTNAAGTAESPGWRIDTSPRFLLPPQAPALVQACGPPVVLSAKFIGISRSPILSVPGTALTHRRAAISPEMQVVWRHRGVPITPGGRHQIQPGDEDLDDPAIQTLINTVTSTLTIADPDYADEGDYDCIVTDGCGPAYRATSQKTWLQLVPTPPWLTLTAEGPDPRSGHGMLYDPARRETILFGGEAFGYDPRPGQPDYYGRYPASDTWTWNGNRWTKRTPANRPPSLREFALAYDQQRQRIVLFGGSRTDGTGQFTNQTWEWDGLDWTLKSPTATPPPRHHPTMCYDTVRQEVLLIGGDIQGGDYYAERKKLWAWNGADWTVRDTAFMGDAFTIPHQGPAFAFDERRGVAVLYDRIQAGQHYVLPEWNGSSWNPGILPPGGALNPAGRGAFYDPWRRLITVTGGSSQPGSTDQSLMHYDGFSWRGENPALLDNVTGSPLDPMNVRITANYEAAFDTHRRACVWLHSRNPFYSSQPFTREIQFSCKPWIAHLPSAVSVQTGQMAQFRVIAAGLPDFSWQWRKNGVPLADGNGILGSHTANLMVLHATASSAGAFSVTVTNRYGSLTSQDVPLTVTGPVLTDSAVIAVPPSSDTATPHATPAETLSITTPGSGTLVLDGTAAGPLPAAPVVYAWRHNGQPVSGTTASLTLTNPDYPDEGEWELFAESSGAPATRRLLQWWRVRLPGDLPYITLQQNGNIPRRTDSMMAYDSRRGVTVAYGGVAYGPLPNTTQTGAYVSDQTWEWDGTGWLLRKLPASPPPLDQAGMVFDSRRGRIVLFGGRKYTGTAISSSSTPSNATWEYDGTTWIQALPQTSPPATTGVSICYDTVRGETLMIGGTIFPYADRHVLWSWNGLNWTRRATTLPYRSSTGPIELYGQNAMAFDESRGVAVLFGSMSGNSSDYDVLEWDGSDWRAVNPAPGAPGESPLRSSNNGTAFYDPFRRMTGIAGAVSLTTEKSLRYWDGTRYFTDGTTIRDSLTTRAWQDFESRPNARNTAVFDRRRRAIVWQDAPAYNFSDRQTRELHFTTAPRLLRLPPQHSGIPGGNLSLHAIAAGQTPITWQWSRSTPLTNDGHFAGTASATLGISGLLPADAGSYTLSASNASGSASAVTSITLGPELQSAGTPGGLWLIWPDPAAVLQTSDSLTSGSWTAVPAATAPFFVPALEPRAFFRVAP